MVHAVAGVRASEMAAKAATFEGSAGLVGEDGLTWRDVVDAINPLEHIPFISTLFNEMMDHTPSPASQIAGGTLLGGPLGFLVGIANVAFQQQTGKGVGGTLLAALTGEDSAPAQHVARAEPPETPMQLASLAAPASVAAMPPIAAVNAAETDAITVSELAAASASAANPKSRAVLDLYGGSAASAHSSYQKAQLRPYLQDVNVSRVL
jgi:hypothetical protein